MIACVDQSAESFGWCPDNGLAFHIKANTIYWEDGDVTPDAAKAVFRAMYRPTGTRYADWTPADRAQVWAKSQATYAAAQARHAAEDEQLTALAEQVLERLTEEERHAVIWYCR